MYYGIGNRIGRMDQVCPMQSTMDLRNWTDNLLLNLQWNWENGSTTYYGIYNGIESMDRECTIESSMDLGEWTNYRL
jgi:hypothetical protein